MSPQSAFSCELLVVYLFRLWGAQAGITMVIAEQQIELSVGNYQNLEEWSGVRSLPGLDVRVQLRRA